jgi:SAM-dependent methyltransferase
MTIQFEARAHCPLCKHDKVKSLYSASFSESPLQQFITEYYQSRVDQSAINEAIYHIVKCSSCGFLYQQNLLNDEGMSALYGHWVDSGQSLKKKKNANARLFRQYARQMETVLQLFPVLPNQVNVLEFGMGWGYWSRMAQAYGFSVAGIELSPARADYARAMGVEVLDKLPEPGPHYHFIYANQVFEHLPDPLETLQNLRNRLTVDGVVYLRVPDGRDVEKSLAKSGWSCELDAIHPFEHINCFTRNSLCQLASRAGLVPIQPPVRLNLGSLWGGLRREFMDRFLTTHVFFRNN